MMYSLGRRITSQCRHLKGLVILNAKERTGTSGQLTRGLPTRTKDNQTRSDLLCHTRQESTHSTTLDDSLQSCNKRMYHANSLCTGIRCRRHADNINVFWLIREKMKTQGELLEHYIDVSEVQSMGGSFCINWYTLFFLHL